jgi:hypothetical protein
MLPEMIDGLDRHSSLCEPRKRAWLLSFGHHIHQAEAGLIHNGGARLWTTLRLMAHVKDTV